MVNCRQRSYCGLIPSSSAISLFTRACTSSPFLWWLQVALHGKTKPDLAWEGSSQGGKCLVCPWRCCQVRHSLPTQGAEDPDQPHLCHLCAQLIPWITLCLSKQNWWSLCSIKKLRRLPKSMSIFNIMEQLSLLAPRGPQKQLLTSNGRQEVWKKNSQKWACPSLSPCTFFCY